MHHSTIIRSVITDRLGNFRTLYDDRQTENAAIASKDLALTADLLSLGH